MWSGMVRSSRGIRRIRWHSSFMLLLTFIHGYAIKNDPISGTMNAPPPPPPRPGGSCSHFCSLPCLLLVECCVVSTDYSAHIHFSLLDRVFSCQGVCVCGTVPFLLFHTTLVLLAPLFILLPLIIFFSSFHSFFIPFHHLSSLLSSSLHPFSSLPLPPRHPSLTPP